MIASSFSLLCSEQHILGQRQSYTYTLCGHLLVGSVAAVLAKCQGLFNKQMWTQLRLYVTSCDGPETAFFNAKRYQAITVNHYCNAGEMTLHPKKHDKASQTLVTRHQTLKWFYDSAEIHITHFSSVWLKLYFEREALHKFMGLLPKWCQWGYFVLEREITNNKKKKKIDWRLNR